jgi:hypothetical protein
MSIKKYAVVENNVVVNVVLAEEPLGQNWIESDVAAIGNAYQNNQFITSEPEADAEASRVREERNVLLDESDWTQVADAPVDKAAWATYRQELRDISAQAGFPWTVVWPTQPE